MQKYDVYSSIDNKFTTTSISHIYELFKIYDLLVAIISQIEEGKQELKIKILDYILRCFSDEDF